MGGGVRAVIGVWRGRRGGGRGKGVGMTSMR